jgi:hypothetical protein
VCTCDAVVDKNCMEGEKLCGGAANGLVLAIYHPKKLLFHLV